MTSAPSEPQQTLPDETQPDGFLLNIFERFAKSEKIQVKLKTQFRRHPFKLTVPLCTRVSLLKLIIERKMHIPICDQRLAFGGEQLDDLKTLKMLKVKNGDCMVLLPVMQSGDKDALKQSAPSLIVFIDGIVSELSNKVGKLEEEGKIGRQDTLLLEFDEQNKMCSLESFPNRSQATSSLPSSESQTQIADAPIIDQNIAPEQIFEEDQTNVVTEASTLTDEEVNAKTRAAMEEIRKRILELKARKVAGKTSENHVQIQIPLVRVGQATPLEKRADVQVEGETVRLSAVIGKVKSKEGKENHNDELLDVSKKQSDAQAQIEKKTID